MHIRTFGAYQKGHQNPLIEEEQAMSRLKKGHQKSLIEEEQAMPRLKKGNQNPLIEEQAMSRLKKDKKIING